MLFILISYLSTLYVSHLCRQRTRTKAAAINSLTRRILGFPHAIHSLRFDVLGPLILQLSLLERCRRKELVLQELGKISLWTGRDSRWLVQNGHSYEKGRLTFVARKSQDCPDFRGISAGAYSVEFKRGTVLLHAENG